jgi:hypothetical protein
MHKFTYPWNALLLIFLLAGISGCHASLEKTRTFKTIFDHYRSRDGITAIGFPPGLLSIILDGEEPEQAELKRLMKELSSFSMLVVEEGTAALDLKEDLGTTVTDFTGRNGFQDLFRVQSGGDDMLIRIKEKEDMVSEAVLMMDSDDGFVVIDLRGNIDIKYFTRLVESGYLSELTKLSELDR